MSRASAGCAFPEKIFISGMVDKLMMDLGCW